MGGNPLRQPRCPHLIPSLLLKSRQKNAKNAAERSQIRGLFLGRASRSARSTPVLPLSATGLAHAATVAESPPSKCVRSERRSKVEKMLMKPSFWLLLDRSFITQRAPAHLCVDTRHISKQDESISSCCSDTRGGKLRDNDGVSLKVSAALGEIDKSASVMLAAFSLFNLWGHYPHMK